MAAPVSKLAINRQHTGQFAQDQAQRLAQQVAVKANGHTSLLNALTNSAYVPLTTDVTISVAAYATLLSVPITTFLASGSLVINVSTSSLHQTGVGTNFFQVLVDGTPIKGTYVTGGTGYAVSASMVLRVPVRMGSHVVTLQWRTDANTARIAAATINEEHAHLFVQESV